MRVDGGLFNGERAFFLGPPDRKIYCVEYIPEPGQEGDFGVVLCKPLWGERIRTHAIFSNLARFLRNNGFTVVTFDYFGDGNSGGESLDLNLSGMIQDLQQASDYLKTLSASLSRFALVGLRLGASCAAMAPTFPGLEKLILIEPVLDLGGYLKTVLRTNLGNQLTVHRKILKTREVLIDELRNGIPVNVDGFHIGKAQWESFEKVSALEGNKDFSGSVLVVSLEEKGRKSTNFEEFAAGYSRGSTAVWDQEFVYSGWKAHNPRPQQLFNHVLGQLSNDNHSGS